MKTLFCALGALAPVWGMATTTATLGDAAYRRVASVPIGLVADTAVFHRVGRRVFSFNGRDGAGSLIQEVNANTFRPMTPIPTELSSRPMAVDPQTGRLSMAAAGVDATGPTAGHPRILPGPLKRQAFGPAR